LKRHFPITTRTRRRFEHRPSLRLDGEFRGMRDEDVLGIR
jgi:hypothetical protein